MLTLGLDEVGRGAWAGPLAVGAVVLDSRNVPENLKDSKKLTRIQREKLAKEIKIHAVAVGVGWVDAAAIDRLGLTKSLILASRNALAQIPAEIRDQIDQIIIDGTQNFLADEPENIREKVTTLIKADDQIAAVSAASIVAKVFRDAYMVQLDKIHESFHFAAHVGYGTAAHLAALREFGALAGIHRQSFAPVAKIAGASSSGLFRGSQVSRNPQLNNLDRSRVGLSRGAAGNDSAASGRLTKRLRELRGRFSRNLGYAAETAAADFLVARGHQILARNWKTKFCEIDIISRKGQTLFFTEVKFRETAAHGDGLAAITPRKLAQTRKAAEIFLALHAEFSRNFDAQISAISLSRNPPIVDGYVANVD